ncbi:MAG: ATP-binding protein [Geobacteraceae bacterium]|nr:ATP-binding protein [Geobacteraceae bacterium]
MKHPSLTAYLREHFSARIFLIFSALIIIVTLAFTAFFFRYQSRSLTEKTESKGELLTTLLAHTVRLGLFTENVALLAPPIDGIMENREVLSVVLYGNDGKILASRNRSGSGQPGGPEKWDAGIGAVLNESTPSLHSRNNGNFVFWRQVALRSRAAPEDAVYFDAGPPRESEQVIGFVRLVLDGQGLRKSMQALLFDSILIGLIFLIIGSVIAYLFAKKVTRPLNRLTEGVNAFGMGREYKEIAVETGDEIGNLAAAFNKMVESLKNREAEKEELAEQLRHSQKMEAIGTLAGGVAHDFNNMLTVINGYGALIKLGLDEGDKLWSYADQIVLSGERAATLTQRLLAYSRKQVISPRPMDLDETIRNLEKMLARLITEDVELRLQLDAADQVVMADPGQLDQVLINLVTNARDAMPQGGTIAIKTGVVTLEDEFVRLHEQEKGGDYAVITVNDNGVGMTEEVRERIFDPFFTTKEVGRGTGLGLSMVYGIVKQHDGIIEVDTEPGRGTSFRIYLPLVERLTEERQVKTPPMPRGNAEMILVAEDDPAVMALLKGVLETNGYAVIEASNGEEAVRKFSAHRDSIRLALLDVIMPRKNGRQVYEEIARLRPDVKALFISGYTHDVIDWKDALAEGTRLISKPVQPAELLLKVKESL